MEDSTNEKVKHEKQRRNIMYYAFWSVCLLFIYILLLKFAISAILP